MTGVLADRDREVGLDGDVGRLVRLLLRRRGRGRQIDRQVDGRERRRDHEDDQQHQHDVDERRHVDLVRLAEFVVVIVAVAEIDTRHRLTPPRATACRPLRAVEIARQQAADRAGGAADEFEIALASRARSDCR